MAYVSLKVKIYDHKSNGSKIIIYFNSRFAAIWVFNLHSVVEENILMRGAPALGNSYFLRLVNSLP